MDMALIAALVAAFATCICAAKGASDTQSQARYMGCYGR